MRRVSESGWIDRQWKRFFVPVDAPTQFLDRDSIKSTLRAASPSTRNVLFAEAQAIFAEPLERAEGVERRATTLVGAVGIAASFSVAGAALLFGSQSLGGDKWRWLVAVILVLVVVCFAMSGYRALQAMSHLHPWTMPDDAGILRRATMSEVEVRIDYAASLLISAGRNEPVARWKVGHLGAATWWLTRALTALVTAVLVLAAYVVWGPTSARPVESTPPPCVDDRWKPRGPPAWGWPGSRHPQKPTHGRHRRCE